MSHPSGPESNLVYDNKFIFNTKSSTDHIHRPPTHKQNKTIYIPDPTNTSPSTNNDNSVAAEVLNVPIDDSEKQYRVQVTDPGDIGDVLMDEIEETNPNTDINLRQDPHCPFPTIP